ncbi:MAG: TetR/AcrR family transcriptional regulator [Bacilli bacterium]|jgi:AcrR family transcriptional regulator|nr:TetR/AcrR family transcriptional regulator [Bacilli bacterium]MCH4210951.1 TetR/AcrR family transcriptional regulator [Bacilli bacterium]MCH4228225.1 TetR/AcrR family transcriptional regulator [Bacilli bacterium]MCH4277421.1 TetR/AcrR family transcriptional regulator [Bacilli bacterium]MCI2055264.1 TetR/AcrR family transcriptional regulator [Bacilli bacterium]
MARPALENIEERIIEATVIVGSRNTANHLSTKEIASIAGVSEGSIYEHFHTKRNLIVQTGRWSDAPFRAEFIRLKRAYPDNFHLLFNGMVDFLLTHPSICGFAVNYSRSFPRFDEDDGSFNRFKSKCVDLLKQLNIATIKDQEHIFEYWNHFIRELFSFSELLIDGKITDTPKNRLVMENLLHDGLFYYLKS